jgi:hypothetical protein
MEQRVPFVRVLKLSRLLETFFIASVTSILVIRAFLAATGYPQLGGARPTHRPYALGGTADADCARVVAGIHRQASSVECCPS